MQNSPDVKPVGAALDEHRKVDDKSQLNIQTHVMITDPETKQIFVNKRG